MIYELAGLRVNIKNRCRYTSEFCKEYLSVDQLSPAAFEAEVTGEEFAEEKKQSEGFSDGYIENICLYRSVCLQMPKYGRFLLHSAVIEYENNAYAFLGRSGIGKSTHTALWINNVKGAEILNGDKPIIGFDESAADGEKFVAYGTPWNGKENRGKKGRAPLKALCFLSGRKKIQSKKSPSAKRRTAFSHRFYCRANAKRLKKRLNLWICLCEPFLHMCCIAIWKRTR